MAFRVIFIFRQIGGYIMTTREYLEQIENLNEKIRSKLIELKEIEEMTIIFTICNPLKEKIKTSKKQDKTANAAIKIYQEKKEADELICIWLNKRKHIIEQINKIEDINLHCILHKIYVEQKTIEKITKEMGYSRSQITRFHKEALLEFEKRFGQEYLEKCS